MSARLAEKLGKPFVIEARPGAGGQAGIEFALSAPSDGYTLISTPSGPISIVPNLRKVQFDPISDLEPVGMLAKVPVGIAVNGDLPIKSIAELIEYSKAQPKGINYSVAAVGTHNRDNVMPLDSVPSTAALTRSGARNANEIVIFTFRTLQRSRSAISSGFWILPLTSSSTTGVLGRSIRLALRDARL